ncbi:DNA polymerase III subunit delta' [Rhodopila sp.]|uniref:DNA polymerase III subunit delta' n=1 Tax=Rhodopila sp. TaxID=2480087 RepID=UPI002B65EDBC|nr:DNA polymerase III subunit delta' [Rhodopila sp.]HVZ08300.1 DNA polymerase III subunit delta' [Rhodopila sp.]
MSAPDPRANPILLGHEAAEATLLEAIRAGRMHHAWLITGPEGVGKATLAFRFARRLLAGVPTGDSLAMDLSHPIFRRVAAGSHADLKTIERERNEKTGRMRTQIAVDAVRDITGFMALTPAEGGWRVVIVDGAEDLNQNSANALLKILEEPPPRAILLLVCAAPGRLLPTIRSRCRRLRLSPVPDAAMHLLLADYLPDLSEAERGRLVTIAEGCPGHALRLAGEEGLTIAALVDRLLGELPAVSPLRGYEIADVLGRSETGFSTFMDLVRAGIAAAVRDSVRGQADPEQERLVALRPLDAWGELWHGLTRLQDETERFALDKRQAIVTSVGMLTGGR